MTAQEITIIMACFAVIQALIALINKYIDKHFGLEKQVSNHLQHKLDEMKTCDMESAKMITGAVKELGEKLGNKLDTMNTLLTRLDERTK